jgi:hypothetical protein
MIALIRKLREANKTTIKIKMCLKFWNRASKTSKIWSSSLSKREAVFQDPMGLLLTFSIQVEAWVCSNKFHHQQNHERLIKFKIITETADKTSTLNVKKIAFWINCQTNNIIKICNPSNINTRHLMKWLLAGTKEWIWVAQEARKILN